MLTAWLLFPAVATVVAGGLGLLADRLAAERLPRALLLPLGLCALVAVGQVTTQWDATAELTVPLVLALAVAGWALGFRRVDPRGADPWPALAALGVFAVFAAPVALSGNATFAGYTLLGDTAIQFIGADALLATGRDFDSLPPSSYSRALANYFDASGYPSGGPVAVGVLARIAFQDVAWVFQALLALLAAGTALALYALIPATLVRPSWLRALAAFAAAQPALVLAYALQGSIKEVGTAFAVATLAALVPHYVRSRPGPRAAIPLALAAAATAGFVGLAAAVWLGPLLLVALAARIPIARRAPLAVALEVAAFCVLAGALAYQSLSQLLDYSSVAGGVVQAQEEFGNLIGPLSNLQMLGVWLSGDYRGRPVGDAWLLTREFIVVAALAALVGLVWLFRRRAWPVLLFVGVSLLGWAFVTDRGSPWADAKALMIVSPAILLVVVLGPFALLRRHRELAAVFGGLILVGVLWSNALLYHSVAVAPRDRMQELADIGQRFDGRGPILFPEFEEFAKYFLREAQVDVIGEPWSPALALREGQPVPAFAAPTDLDQLGDAALVAYPTIVLRRGFAGSRPPAAYRRTHSGRFYDVWERQDGPRLLTHLAAGSWSEPGAVPACSDIEALAREAIAAGGTLRAAERAPLAGFVPAEEQHPPAWAPDGARPDMLNVVGPGRVEGVVQLPADGRWDLWLEGSDQRSWRALVDGRVVSEGPLGLSYRGGMRHLATLTLPAGRHRVVLERAGGGLAGGNGLSGRLGRVGFTPAGEAAGQPAEVPPTRWRELCGRRVDWIEAVAPGGPGAG